jgi:hypothetical protein
MIRCPEVLPLVIARAAHADVRPTSQSMHGTHDMHVLDHEPWCQCTCCSTQSVPKHFMPLALTEDSARSWCAFVPWEALLPTAVWSHIVGGPATSSVLTDRCCPRWVLYPPMGLSVVCCWRDIIKPNPHRVSDPHPFTFHHVSPVFLQACSWESNLRSTHC